MAPYLRELFDEHPDLRAPTYDAPRGEAFAMKTIGKALVDLYNPHSSTSCSAFKRC
ncbi:hypothetical protein MOQ72_28265 [Saccharopolyspora sp. K220]|uniref:hypothetical protein n=1 Tax=Saccharopolyspora soli TaxID=2926618 RepID=UPI001F59D104|nr:hypothetical protein [Saccharopolyspora soli]MCI2421342.1 hypothetical protein [Saccharopolyspora soli]